MPSPAVLSFGVNRSKIAALVQCLSDLRAGNARGHFSGIAPELPNLCYWLFHFESFADFDLHAVGRALLLRHQTVVVFARVDVLDFVLAKALAWEQSEVDLSELPTVSAMATEEGRILGTPGYLSPGQVRGKAIASRPTSGRLAACSMSCRRASMRFKERL